MHQNLRLHITIAILVPGFLALGWWQLTRAISGNDLSWAYVFEWPLFAGYAVYMWWKLTHEEAPPEKAAGPALPGSAESPGVAGLEPEPESEQDKELAAYNDYLAALHVSGKPKRW